MERLINHLLKRESLPRHDQLERRRDVTLRQDGKPLIRVSLSGLRPLFDFREEAVSADLWIEQVTSAKVPTAHRPSRREVIDRGYQPASLILDQELLLVGQGAMQDLPGGVIPKGQSAPRVRGCQGIVQLLSQSLSVRSDRPARRFILGAFLGSRLGSIAARGKHCDKKKQKQ